MVLGSSAPGVWDRVWGTQQAQGKGLQWELERDLSIVRWGAFLEIAHRELGSLRGRRSIELGAGRGFASLQLARSGAEVTLVDWSDSALEAAAQLYAQLDLKPTLIKADILDLPEECYGRYDIALSIGVGEHFAGSDRLAMIRSHALALRPGGMALISVPNASCPPYRVGKWIAEKRGRWKFGVEIPFSRAELADLVRQAGLEPVAISGSSLGEATSHWILRPYGGTLLNRLTGWLPALPESQTPFGQIPTPLLAERSSWVDDRFGYLFNLIVRRVD